MPDVNENLLRRLKSLIDSGDPTLLSLLGQTKSNDGNGAILPIATPYRH